MKRRRQACNKSSFVLLQENVHRRASGCCWWCMYDVHIAVSLCALDTPTVWVQLLIYCTFLSKFFLKGFRCTWCVRTRWPLSKFSGFCRGRVALNHLNQGWCPSTVAAYYIALCWRGGFVVGIRLGEIVARTHQRTHSLAQSVWGPNAPI